MIIFAVISISPRQLNPLDSIFLAMSSCILATRNSKRLQFNNDDSGRMLIFEGNTDMAMKGAQFLVRGITYGSTKPGDTKVDHVAKASGVCSQQTDGTIRCHVIAEGMSVEAGMINPKKADPDFLQKMGITPPTSPTYKTLPVKPTEPPAGTPLGGSK
jgi:hypothetical protein